MGVIVLISTQVRIQRLAGYHSRLLRLMSAVERCELAFNRLETACEVGLGARQGEEITGYLRSIRQDAKEVLDSVDGDLVELTSPEASA